MELDCVPLLEEVFTHLPLPTLLTSRLVCKSWAAAASPCVTAVSWRLQDTATSSSAALQAALQIFPRATCGLHIQLPPCAKLHHASTLQLAGPKPAVQRLVAEAVRGGGLQHLHCAAALDLSQAAVQLPRLASITLQGHFQLSTYQDLWRALPGQLAAQLTRLHLLGLHGEVVGPAVTPSHLQLVSQHATGLRELSLEVAVGAADELEAWAAALRSLQRLTLLQRLVLGGQGLCSRPTLALAIQCLSSLLHLQHLGLRAAECSHGHPDEAGAWWGQDPQDPGPGVWAGLAPGLPRLSSLELSLDCLDQAVWDGLVGLPAPCLTHLRLLHTGWSPDFKLLHAQHHRSRPLTGLAAVQELHLSLGDADLLALAGSPALGPGLCPGLHHLHLLLSGMQYGPAPLDAAPSTAPSTPHCLPQPSTQVAPVQALHHSPTGPTPHTHPTPTTLSTPSPDTAALTPTQLDQAMASTCQSQLGLHPGRHDMATGLLEGSADGAAADPGQLAAGGGGVGPVGAGRDQAEATGLAALSGLHCLESCHLDCRSYCLTPQDVASWAAAWPHLTSLTFNGSLATAPVPGAAARRRQELNPPSHAPRPWSSHTSCSTRGAWQGQVGWGGVVMQGWAGGPAEGKAGETRPCQAGSARLAQAGGSVGLADPEPAWSRPWAPLRTFRCLTCLRLTRANSSSSSSSSSSSGSSSSSSGIESLGLQPGHAALAGKSAAAGAVACLHWADFPPCLRVLELEGVRLVGGGAGLNSCPAQALDTVDGSESETQAVPDVHPQGTGSSLALTGEADLSEEQRCSRGSSSAAAGSRANIVQGVCLASLQQSMREALPPHCRAAEQHESHLLPTLLELRLWGCELEVSPGAWLLGPGCQALLLQACQLGGQQQGLIRRLVQACPCLHSLGLVSARPLQLGPADWTALGGLGPHLLHLALGSLGEGLGQVGAEALGSLRHLSTLHLSVASGAHLHLLTALSATLTALHVVRHAALEACSSSHFARSQHWEAVKSMLAAGLPNTQVQVTYVA